jgi:hypothetical protein
LIVFRFLFQVISHPVWEIAIALCIIANSIQLIIEHPLDTGAKYTVSPHHLLPSSFLAFFLFLLP